MTRTEIMSQAVATWGVDAQMGMAVEEASELIQALCKFRRHAGREQFADVLEEMADMRIMLDQLSLMFGDCSDIEATKIKRLDEMLNRCDKRCG